MIKSVTLVLNEGKSHAVETGAALRSSLESKGLQLDTDRPDLVISLGGDGTMLRAAQLAHSADALLLGVNLGTLGYLSEVDAPDAEAAVTAVLDGDHQVEERMMLVCDAGDGWRNVALNEALVERTSRKRLVRLEVRIGGESLAAFNADGVIVATPTGSTAYALSAGGPIVSPRAACLVLVPVSPHMIFSRPFILAPDEEVEILVQHDQHAILSLDGAIGCDLEAEARVTIKRDPRPLRLVRLQGPGFLERLRVKLDLPRATDR